MPHSHSTTPPSNDSRKVSRQHRQQLVCLQQELFRKGLLHFPYISISALMDREQGDHHHTSCTQSMHYDHRDHARKGKQNAGAEGRRRKRRIINSHSRHQEAATSRNVRQVVSPELGHGKKQQDEQEQREQTSARVVVDESSSITGDDDDEDDGDDAADAAHEPLRLDIVVTPPYNHHDHHSHSGQSSSFLSSSTLHCSLRHTPMSLHDGHHHHHFSSSSSSSSSTPVVCSNASPSFASPSSNISVSPTAVMAPHDGTDGDDGGDGNDDGRSRSRGRPSPRSERRSGSSSSSASSSRTSTHNQKVKKKEKGTAQSHRHHHDIHCVRAALLEAFTSSAPSQITVDLKDDGHQSYGDDVGQLPGGDDNASSQRQMRNQHHLLQGKQSQQLYQQQRRLLQKSQGTCTTGNLPVGLKCDCTT